MSQPKDNRVSRLVEGDRDRPVGHGAHPLPHSLRDALASGAVNEDGEVDLSKVAIPSNVEISEADATVAAAKKKAPARKKVAAPKE